MLKTPKRAYSKPQPAATQRQRKKRKVSHDKSQDSTTPPPAQEPSLSKKSKTATAAVEKEDESQVPERGTKGKKRKKTDNARGAPVAKKRTTRSQAKKIKDSGGDLEEVVDVDLDMQDGVAEEPDKEVQEGGKQEKVDKEITNDGIIDDESQNEDGMEVTEWAQNDIEEEDKNEKDQPEKADVEVESVMAGPELDGTLQEQSPNENEEPDQDEAVDSNNKIHLGKGDEEQPLNETEGHDVKVSEDAANVAVDELPQSPIAYEASQDRQDDQDDQSSILSDPPSNLSDLDFTFADKAQSGMDSSNDEDHDTHPESDSGSSVTSPLDKVRPEEEEPAGQHSEVGSQVEDDFTAEEIGTTEVIAVKETMRETAVKIKINLKKLKDLGVDLEKEYLETTSTEEEATEEEEEEDDEEGSEFEVDENEEDDDESGEFEEEATVRDEESTEVIRRPQSKQVEQHVDTEEDEQEAAVDVEDDVDADDASDESHDTSHTQEAIVVRQKPTQTSDSTAQSTITKNLARVPHVLTSSTSDGKKSVTFAPAGVEVINDPTQPPAKKSPEVFHIGGHTIIDDTDDNDEWEADYAADTGKKGRYMTSAKGLSVEQTVKAWQKGALHPFHREGRTPGMAWVPPWLRK